MSTVTSAASTSLDGFVALPDNQVGPLFDWYATGDVELETAMPGLSFRLTAQSAAYVRSWWEGLGAIVVGRVQFDVAEGWDGRHPLGVPVVVVTHRVPDDWARAHPDAAFTFVTDGVPAAVARARELAGERSVRVAAGTIARQCLEAGLLDEVAVDLVPAVLGAGRPYFGGLGTGAAVLGDPTTCVRGERVTHLVFPVRHAGSSTGGSGTGGPGGA